MKHKIKIRYSIAFALVCYLLFTQVIFAHSSPSIIMHINFSPDGIIDKNHKKVTKQLIKDFRTNNKQYPSASINLTSFSDKTISREYRTHLAERYSTIIKTILIDEGVSENNITETNGEYQRETNLLQKLPTNRVILKIINE